MAADQSDPLLAMLSGNFNSGQNWPILVYVAIVSGAVYLLIHPPATY